MQNSMGEEAGCGVGMDCRPAALPACPFVAPTAALLWPIQLRRIDWSVVGSSTSAGQPLHLMIAHPRDMLAAPCPPTPSFPRWRRCPRQTIRPQQPPTSKAIGLHRCCRQEGREGASPNLWRRHFPPLPSPGGNFSSVSSVTFRRVGAGGKEGRRLGVTGWEPWRQRALRVAAAG